MGFSMIDVIRKVRNEINFHSLDMRIGVHTVPTQLIIFSIILKKGDIIGGITGINIVRYDIYGINVTIANKMESNGKIGRVHISSETKNTLELNYLDHFIFEENKEGPVKL